MPAKTHPAKRRHSTVVLERVAEAFLAPDSSEGFLGRGGEPRMKKLPAPESLSAGSSVEMVAGVRYEARQTELPWELEVVLLSFATRGTALVPARSTRGEMRTSAMSVALGA